MFGAYLALASAAFFGLNNATVRRGVLKSTVLQGMAITVPLGVPIFLVLAVFFGGYDTLESWPLQSWIWMALAGLVHFVIGRYGNYRATQALGATLSTPVQQLSILVSLVLAVVFLSEKINAVNIFGIVLVMLGPMLLMCRRKQSEQAAKNKNFTPDFRAGLIWGLICAFGYGTSPLLIAYGLGENPTLADGLAGVLVSYCAASIAVFILVYLAGGRSYMATLDRGSGGWFLLSAIFVAFSQLFRYMALTVAPVSVVVPIQRLSVAFRILFNAVLNREHEVFDLWVLASIFLAIIGAGALTLDSIWLLDTIAVPDQFKQMLSSPIF